MNLKSRLSKLERNQPTGESMNEAFEMPASPHDAGAILQQLAELGVIPFHATDENMLIVKRLFGKEGQL